MRNKNTHLVASLQLYPNSYEMLHTSAENLETKSFSVARLRTSRSFHRSPSQYLTKIHDRSCLASL